MARELKATSLRLGEGGNHLDLSAREMLDRLHLLSGQEFERLCGQLFEALGYDTKYTSTTSDRGIDLELTRDGRLVLVQCKRQQSSVGEPAVRDFFGVVTQRGAHKGIFCTNGAFSTRAEAWAAGTRVELLDGAELVRLWQQYAVEVPIPDISPPEQVVPATATPASESRESARHDSEQPETDVSEGVLKRRYNADRKWVAAKCVDLGIPRPTGPTDYTAIDGDYRKRLFVGPDGRGEYVVVHDGEVLFRGSTRRSAMEYYDRVKLDY